MKDSGGSASSLLANTWSTNLLFSKHGELGHDEYVSRETRTSFNA